MTIGRAWVCAAPPVASVGAIREMSNLSHDALVVVYEAADHFMSWAVKQQLEEAGVPVVEHVDRSPYAYDWAFPGSVLFGRYSRLLTPESRVAQARSIIADFLAAYERGDLELPGKGAGESPQDGDGAGQEK